ncbi:Nuclear-interacting partner of ALK [Dispira simplex]|nr:Nuclear-interacting partner of ALK [Dispira simplex]
MATQTPTLKKRRLTADSSNGVSPTMSTTPLVPTSAYSNFQPWDKSAFLQRLATFQPRYDWPERYPELNPVLCSRYGWTNVAKATLRCSVCPAKLRIDDKALRSSEPAQTAREVGLQVTLQTYGVQLRSAHLGTCPWRLAYCEPGVYRPLTKTSTEVFKDYSRFLDSFPHQPDFYPAVTHPLTDDEYANLKNQLLDRLSKSYLSKRSDIKEETTSALLPPTTEASFTSSTTASTPPSVPAVKSSSSEAQDHPDNVNVKVTTSRLAVATLLYLFGWQPEHLADRTVYVCSMCFRKVPVWTFRSACRNDPSTLPLFDVCREHRSFCYWINNYSDSVVTTTTTDLIAERTPPQGILKSTPRHLPWQDRFQILLAKVDPHRHQSSPLGKTSTQSLNYKDPDAVLRYVRKLLH